MTHTLKTISRKSDVRKVGLHEISQFLAQLNMLYSTVQGIGKFRADLLFSHQTFVKWPLVAVSNEIKTVIFQ